MECYFAVRNYSGNDWSMKPPTDTDPKARGIAILDEYAMGRWECVLHFMVGSHQHEVISSDALQILQHAGLMKKYSHIQSTEL